MEHWKIDEEDAITSTTDKHTDNLRPIISILIPARNEAENISACLYSILPQIDKHLPQVAELIVIDDHSEDDTARIVSDTAHPKLSLLQLRDKLKNRDNYNAYKKLALAYGLENATGEYILQLDADIIANPDFLSTILRTIDVHNPDMIAGPVIFTSDGSKFQDFQSLDILGMMALTATGIKTRKWFLANGANLTYRRGLVSFSDSDTASGDDISAIQKLSQASQSKILFLTDKKGVVYTSSLETVSKFASQRLRWGTKNKKMKGLWTWLIMGIPFANIIWLIVHPIAFILLGEVALMIALLHILFKLGMDYLYLTDVSEFYGERSKMRSFWYSSVAHIAYIGVIGVMSLFAKKYTWKDRHVS